MIRKSVILVLAMAILVSFAGCGLKRELHEQTKTFYDIVNGTIPQDLHLTIYYVNSEYESYLPQSLESLMLSEALTVISVPYEELVQHQDHLKKFDPALLVPVSGENFVDARFYYVFELGDSGPIMEYTLSYLGSDYINGIPIKEAYEMVHLVAPFLPEDSIYKDYPRSLVNRTT